MPVGLTYNSFFTELVTMLVVPADDADFLTHMPQIIDGAELRLSRDLDPLALRTDQTTTLSATSPGNARFGVPPTCVVLREVGYYTPAGSGPDNGGTWNPLDALDPQVIRTIWPSRATVGRPVYYGIYDNVQGLLGPAADAAYLLHMFFTQRLPPLSAAAPTVGNWLSLNVPDLYLYAAAVVASGFLKNYGALSDDPQAPMTWEKLYTKILGPAQLEEARRRQQAFEFSRAPTQPPNAMS